MDPQNLGLALVAIFVIAYVALYVGRAELRRLQEDRAWDENRRRDVAALAQSIAADVMVERGWTR